MASTDPDYLQTLNRHLGFDINQVKQWGIVDDALSYRLQDGTVGVLIERPGDCSERRFWVKKIREEVDRELEQELKEHNEDITS